VAAFNTFKLTILNGEIPEDDGLPYRFTAQTHSKLTD